MCKCQVKVMQESELRKVRITSIPGDHSLHHSHRYHGVDLGFDDVVEVHLVMVDVRNRLELHSRRVPRGMPEVDHDHRSHEQVEGSLVLHICPRNVLADSHLPVEADHGCCVQEVVSVHSHGLDSVHVAVEASGHDILGLSMDVVGHDDRNDHRSDRHREGVGHRSHHVGMGEVSAIGHDYRADALVGSALCQSKYKLR